MLRTFAGAALTATFLVLSPSLAAAQASPAAETAAAQPLIDDFVAAVNGGPDARAAFVTRRLAATPQMSRADLEQALEAVSRTSGGLKVQTWRHRGRLRLTVVAANGKTGRVDLFQDAADPTRLTALIPVATPAPYEGPRLTAPVSRQALAAAIDQRVRFAADRDDFSGAVLVMKDGEVIYSGMAGEADKAAHKPVTLETRFNLGSMGKQFTAVAIGQLIDDGKLALDTRLIDVLPDYPNPEAARKITIRHLLSHSAGLGMLFERPGWDWKLRYQTMGELLPLFAKAPLAFEPGARGAYSNEGFIVLGAVVEKLSGRTWYDYVQTNVFDRAGMSHTANLTDDPAVPDRAVGYRFGPDDPLGFGKRQDNWDTLSWRGNACGGQFSTVGDMIRFLQALRGGKLLKPETAALFTRQAPGGLSDYGLGFEHFDAPSGRNIVGHAGGGPASGVNSDAKMIWETGYAYAVLGNYDSPFAQTIGRDISDMLAAQN
jgi:CubicO group peptidase (beta-lactamase class C family)